MTPRVPGHDFVSPFRVHQTIMIDERGDTLLEVLMAVVIIGLASVALLATLVTSITSSGEHRSLVDSRHRPAKLCRIGQVRDPTSPDFRTSNSSRPLVHGLTSQLPIRQLALPRHGVGRRNCRRRHRVHRSQYSPRTSLPSNAVSVRWARQRPRLLHSTSPRLMSQQARRAAT